MTGTRLAFHYGAAFTVIGIHLPFWPVWLASRGLTPQEIGYVVAVGVAVKVVTNPLIAHVADRLGERRRPMVVLAALSLIAFSGFAAADGFWAIMALTVCFFVVWAPIMPLVESLTMLSARAHRLDYGRIRLWGSLTFIVAAVGTGRLLVGRGEDLIMWLILVGIALTVSSAYFVPDHRAPKATGGRPTVFAVLGDRTFVLFLLAAALIQASHSVYYAFGTIHWQRAGYGEDVIGWLWAEGVVAEIVLFVFGARLVASVGPARLIALGGAAGLVRWVGTGLSDALPVLVVLQALHAFTFGAIHLGAIHFIASRVNPALSATAQSVYSAVVIGLGLGTAVLVSGQLYATFAGRAYLAMALIAALGGALAFSLRRRR